MVVNILGTKYTIDYEELKNADYDGYCDMSSRHIVVRSDNVNELEDFESHQKKQLRHEIIHAFLNESGLQANFEHANRWGHDETMVDWFAIQAPKIFELLKEIGCL